MKQTYLLFCLFFFSVFSFTASKCTAQTKVSDFGEFSDEEFSIKECSFDKTADAVVFFDQAVSNYNDNHNLVTERRIRFKILKEKGIERGNVHIRFYSKDKFEFIANIKAVTAYSGANGIVWARLDPKKVYTRQLNEISSEVVFAIPNVQVGSVIEYSYQSVMEHYGGLQDWYFQQELPVVLSSYKLYIIPNASFNYVVKKSRFMDITVAPDKTAGSVLFEMKNIPGLRDEAYSTSYRDYLQRVNFQLSEIQYYSGGTARFSNNWNELARDFADDKYFGGQINKNISTLPSLLLTTYTDPFHKMQFIHNYVRKNFQWNDIYSLSCSDGLKTVVDHKKGNAGELNLLLINMLKAAGLNAYPLLVSDRWHGKVDTTYSFRDQFDKVVSLVFIADKKYILDATDDVTPSDMIPSSLLNTIGFLVDRKQSAFVHLVDDSKNKTSLIELNGDISADGEVKATALVDYYDYARVGQGQNYIHNKQKYIEQFSSSLDGLKIDSFSISGVDNDSVKLHHDLQLRYPLTKSGSYYLLNFNLFTNLNKNPFIADYRFTDIDFGTRLTTLLHCKFTLPEQMAVDALPKNLTLRTPDRGFQVIRQITQNNNTIEVGVRIEFRNSLYGMDDYVLVKDFFTKMIDLLNEPIVLKAK